MLDRTVGRHLPQPIGNLELDGGNVGEPVDGLEDMDWIALGRLDGEEALTPEPGTGLRHLRPIAEEPVALGRPAEGLLGQPIGVGRTPRLPALLVDEAVADIDRDVSDWVQRVSPSRRRA